MDDKIGDKIQEVIERIVDGKGIDVLLRCENPKKALDMLITLAPETLDPEMWPIFTRRLVCYLQRVYHINFRVCKVLIIEGNEQFCGADGLKAKCDHDIMAVNCERRGTNGKPEQPDSSHIIFSEELNDYMACAGI